MSGSHDAGPAAERDLQDTRDELAQASIALNTAYDRLQGLRASLRSFTAQRDRLTGIRRTHQQARLQGDELMGPEHSAIVLSDSDEESEIDMEALREFLPFRLVDLATASGNQYTHLSAAARQFVTTDSRNSSSLYSSAFSSDEPRLVYPQPPRRRRLPPPAPRDGAIIPPPNAASPARRSILEAHMRHLRRASSPTESSTTLGRRVTQRAAAHAAAAGRQSAGTGTATASDTVIRSTLPIGLEPRPSPLPRSYSSTDLPGIESRAAAHLRYTLLPNPPSGTRLSGSRMPPTSGAHSRFNDRLEHRARTAGSAAGSNSLNSVSHGPSPTPALVQESQPHNPISLRPSPPRQSTGTQPPSWEEDAPRFNFGDLYSNSRPRRRVHAQGQEQMLDPSSFEHVFLVNPPVEPDFTDAPSWLRRQIQGYRSVSTHGAQSGADTDRTIHAPRPPASAGTRPTGQDGGVRRRRRGWARLDPNGDEISTEDEANLERMRTDPPPPGASNQTDTAPAAGSGPRVLNFMNHNARDVMMGHRDANELLEGLWDEDGALPQDRAHSHEILDGLFHMEHSTYINPLPVQIFRKGRHSRMAQTSNEVRVTVDPKIAGR